VLGGRRLPLHPRWNVMNSVLLFAAAGDVFGPEAVAQARESAAIRHFEGPDTNKPWHHLCESELRELYLEHRRGTPWPRTRRPRFSIRRKRMAAV
jgi:lipopolysaccharide biosynthesis glycosyltransferase